MSEEKQEKGCHNYIVEREFLNRISVTELISRIIQSHSAHILRKETEIT